MAGMAPSGLRTHRRAWSADPRLEVRIGKLRESGGWISEPKEQDLMHDGVFMSVAPTRPCGSRSAGGRSPAPSARTPVRRVCQIRTETPEHPRPCTERLRSSEEDAGDAESAGGAAGHGDGTPDGAEPELLYSVSTGPADPEKDQRVRLETPFWTVGHAASKYGEAGRRSGNNYLTKQRAIRAVAHFTALFFLGTADILFFLEHRDGSDAGGVVMLSIVLLLLYAGLTLWLVVSCALPTTWEMSGFGIAHLPKTWLVLALAHTATAFVSSWWREAISSSDKVEPGSHAAAMISMLQLLLMVLYPSSPAVAASLACLSVMALIIIEVVMGVEELVILDNALLLLCAGVTCVVAASWQYWADRNLQMKSKLVNCFIENIFQPIITKQSDPQQAAGVTTRIGQITKRLKEAKDRCADSNLDEDMKDLFDNFFGFLLEELTDLNLLNRMPIQNLNLSPMTAEYVQKTLGQGDNHNGMLETVESIQKTIDANLQTGNLQEGDGSIPKMDRVEEADRPEKPPTHTHWTSVRDTEERPETLRQQTPDLPQLAAHPSDGGGSAGSPACASRPRGGPEPAPPGAGGAGSFEESVEAMSRALCACRWESLPYPRVSEDFGMLLQKKLGLWHLDIFKLTSYVGGRPLAVVGDVALSHVVSKMHIDASRVRHFLDSIESRYMCNPYHNSMHGADVMNNMLYFLRLQDTALAKLEPIEHLAVLTAAAAHDVGHDGFANRFHTGTESPLARLFNDQSPLENMHCAIAFAALRERKSDFLDGLEAPARTVFRSYVTQMILETDLAKHVQTLARFTQELLRGNVDAGHHNFAQRKELATFTLKCSDVAHSTKHFDIHVLWTLRINEEFFHQGDFERSAGLPCSPFCNREDMNVAESQRGFYDFIVCPLFKALDDHLGGKIQGEVMRQMERNCQFWKRYDGAGFDYDAPVLNAGLLRDYYQALYADVPSKIPSIGVTHRIS